MSASLVVSLECRVCWRDAASCVVPYNAHNTHHIHLIHLCVRVCVFVCDVSLITFQQTLCIYNEYSAVNTRETNRCISPSPSNNSRTLHARKHTRATPLRNTRRHNDTACGMWWWQRGPSSHSSLFVRNKCTPHTYILTDAI